MQFGLTIPLIKHLQLKKVPYGHEIDLFFCWELHYLRLDKQDTLIAVNANNRFSVILSGMNSSDWKRYPTILQQYLRQAFLDVGYTNEAIDLYFNMAKAIEITKTHGRRPVAYLNKMVDTLYQYRYDLDTEQLYQSFLIHDVNHTKCRATGFHEHGLAIAFLEADMNRLGIKK